MSICLNALASKATRLAFQLYRTLEIFQSDQQEDNSTQSYCRSRKKPGDTVISGTVVAREDDSEEPKMSVHLEFTYVSNGVEQVSN